MSANECSAATGLDPMSDQFWYNLRTGKVETNYDKSQGKDLMGPYPTRTGAEQALRSARERTRRWDDEDRRWREGDGDEG